jgi:hypothetical protein
MLKETYQTKRVENGNRRKVNLVGGPKSVTEGRRSRDEDERRGACPRESRVKYTIACCHSLVTRSLSFLRRCRQPVKLSNGSQCILESQFEAHNIIANGHTLGEMSSRTIEQPLSTTNRSHWWTSTNHLTFTPHPMRFVPPSHLVSFMTVEYKNNA